MCCPGIIGIAAMLPFLFAVLKVATSHAKSRNTESVGTPNRVFIHAAIHNAGFLIKPVIFFSSFNDVEKL